MKVKVKFFNDTYEGKNFLNKPDYKGNWVDLRASEDIFIPLNNFSLIPLGIAMQLPEGYEAHVVPRSSTFKNFGIIQTNHQSIIDEAYCGNDDQWFIPAYCLEAKYKIGDISGTFIHKGDRICQFRIEKRQPELEYEIVEKLENINRNGHGSTGRN